MPQADTSLKLDWNRKTGTQAGCDWPHARHTVVLYHLVCSFFAEMLLFMNPPEEMIMSIFEYIAITERIKFRGVKKSWAKLVVYQALLKNLDFSMVTESFQEHYLDIDLSNSTHVILLKLFQCDIDGYATLCRKSLNEESQQSKFQTLKKLTVIRTELDSVNLFRFYKAWRTWSI